MARQKHPVSVWLVAERKRLGWKPADVSRRLLEMGYEAELATVGVWESGRKPKDETIEGLERLFGSQAPRESDTSRDVTALIAAIDRLVQSQAELTAELREARLGGPARLVARAVEAGTVEAERVGEGEAAPPVAARAPARRGRR